MEDNDKPEENPKTDEGKWKVTSMSQLKPLMN